MAKAATSSLVAVGHTTRGFESLPSPPTFGIAQAWERSPTDLISFISADDA